MMAHTYSIRPDVYCELHAHSCYSLLDGVPTPEQLAGRAAELGLPAVALTDHDALYGAAPFYLRARELGLKPILGAELTLEDGSHLTLLCETDTGYANLCRLITAGRLGASQGESCLPWNVLARHTPGLLCLTGCRRGKLARHAAEGDLPGARAWLSFLTGAFGRQNVYVEIQRHLGRDDVKISRRLAALASGQNLPCVATGNIHYLSRKDGEVQSALAAIRGRKPLTPAGDGHRPDYEYFMRPARDMLALFPDLPEAVTNTVEIARRCQASLPVSRRNMPAFPTPNGQSSGEYLRALCLERLPRLYPSGRQAEARARLDQELATIQPGGLADYYLIIWDIVEFCGQRGIQFHGRGAAALGVVARLLGIGAGDPTEGPAFVQNSFAPAPDIGLDIDASERERVVEYVYERWGDKRVGQACRFTVFGPAAALREAGFALGFDPGAVEAVASGLGGDPRSSESGGEALVERPETLLAQLAGDLRNRAAALAPDECRRLLRLAGRLQGRPRQAVAHPGLLVIAGRPITGLIPVEPVGHDPQAIVQFDMDALGSLGLARLDLRGQAMLSAIAETERLVRDTTHVPVELRELDCSDKAVYDLICSARTLGVTGETDAPIGLIPCMQPRSFQDLVVEVTLMLRPSGLRRRMVEHYRRRRDGSEPAACAQPLLEPALAETLGVLIFQEQAIEIARDAAGFAPGRCEQLRRALISQTAPQAVRGFRLEFMEGARLNGLAGEAAGQIWSMLSVFAAHSCSRAEAAAVARLIYCSAWLRLNYPAEYFCGQLRTALPGSHTAHVLESEARRAAVKFLPFDVNRSWGGPAVERGAVRLGLSHANGIDDRTAEAILLARGNRPFLSLADLIQRTRLERRAVEWLILSGASDSLGERPHLLWELAETFNVARRPEPRAEALDEYVDLEDMSEEQQLLTVFAATTGRSRMHLTEVRRDSFTKAGCLPWERLRRARVGARVKVGGLVARGVRRPPESNGAAFLRLDEPQGSIDVLLPADVYLRFRDALRSAFLVVEGTVQKQGAVVGVTAHRVVALE